MTYNFTLIMSWMLYLKTVAFVKSTIDPFYNVYKTICIIFSSTI